MKISSLSLVTCLLVAGASGVVETAGAQASTRAYREGPVIQVSYIRTKPGMFDKYMQYLAAFVLHVTLPTHVTHANFIFCIAKATKVPTLSNLHISIL